MLRDNHVSTPESLAEDLDTPCHPRLRHSSLHPLANNPSANPIQRKRRHFRLKVPTPIDEAEFSP